MSIFKKIFTWGGMLITLTLPLFLLGFLDGATNISSVMESRFSAISWLITGIVGFLALIVLYLSIILENRILKKIRGLNDYFQPFGFGISEIYRNLHIYISKTGMKDLIFLYSAYLIAVNSLNALWIILLKYYVPLHIYELIHINNWSINLNSLSYFVFYSLAISFILFSLIVGFMLLLIINEKNIFGKYKLPKGKELFDIEYLLDSKASVGEILKKSNPTLHIYYNEENLELYIDSLLPLYNITYHYKFYKYQESFKLNIYQKISKETNFEKNESVKVKKGNYKLDINSFVQKKIDEIFKDDVLKELIIYDNKGNIIVKLKLNLTNQSLLIDRELPIPHKNLEKEKIKKIDEETIVELN